MSFAALLYSCVSESMMPAHCLDNPRILEVVNVVKHHHQFALATGDAANERDHPVLDRGLVAFSTDQ